MFALKEVWVFTRTAPKDILRLHAISLIHSSHWMLVSSSDEDGSDPGHGASTVTVCRSMSTSVIWTNPAALLDETDLALAGARSIRRGTVKMFCNTQWMWIAEHTRAHAASVDMNSRYEGACVYSHVYGLLYSLVSARMVTTNSVSIVQSRIFQSHICFSVYYSNCGILCL